MNVIEDFYGVYLLFCKNPKYIGRVYIGYTVDPNRRIKQHNKGKEYGGAWKTSKKGPWEMVMVIHGFPNNISALRFEWAWQHPQASRRLQHVPKKKSREKTFEYTLRVLSEILVTPPWRRLPLTIRWLSQEFAQTLNKAPPIHMPICAGAVVSKKISSTTSKVTNGKKCDDDDTGDSICYFCNESGAKMHCLNPECTLRGHILCFSKLFLEPSEYVPVEGQCTKCGCNYLWGDLVRKFKGCYQVGGENALSPANFYYHSDGESE